MSEIFHNSNHVFEKSLFKIEEMLWQNILHKEILHRYKNCKTFPKVMHLKFNLSLCKEDRNLQRNCNFILRAAAGKIQDQMIKSLNIKISSLRQKIRNLLKSASKQKSLKNSLNRSTVKSKELLIRKEKK